jgi:Cu+-exporting ATPase
MGRCKMPEKVKDPVCGMEIDKEKAKGPASHMGRSFYFCSESCQKKFEKEPMKYMDKK